MQEGGFKLSEADPCMLYKEDENGVCIIIIYIDDMLIIGKEKAIDDAIKVLQGHFQVKDPTSLVCFGCEFVAFCHWLLHILLLFCCIVLVVHPFCNVIGWDHMVIHLHHYFYCCCFMILLHHCFWCFHFVCQI